MKRIWRLWTLLICLAVALSACRSSTKPAVGPSTSWQEQYDLGVRYLSEGNYEEAITAFTVAIEIDPKQAPAYVGRGDAYFAIGDYSNAKADYNYALELDPELDLLDKLSALDKALSAEEAEHLQEELYPFIADFDVPFSVDNIVLGVTDIATAKATYSSRPYAFSNLMNDDSEDTVYTCFGMNDMPIPEGHEEDEFGFLFAGPAEGGAIHDIIVQDRAAGLTCLGGLHIGDSDTDAFEFFGFPEKISMDGLHMEWTLKNGATLSYSGSEKEAQLTYKLDGKSASVFLQNGAVYGVYLKVESEA